MSRGHRPRWLRQAVHTHPGPCLRCRLLTRALRADLVRRQAAWQTAKPSDTEVDSSRVASSAAARLCLLCRARLDQPGRPETADLGGDCARCMADAGDPYARGLLGQPDEDPDL